MYECKFDHEKDWVKVPGEVSARFAAEAYVRETYAPVFTSREIERRLIVHVRGGYEGPVVVPVRYRLVLDERVDATTRPLEPYLG